MKLSCVFLFLPLITILQYGCWNNNPGIAEKSSAGSDPAITVPQPEKIDSAAPAKKAAPEKIDSAKKSPSPEQRPAVSTPAEPKTAPVITPAPAAAVVKSAPEVKPAPTKDRPPEKFRRGAGLWKAFSRLSPEEQRQLMQIQLQDPERFKQLMQEKIDLLYRQEQSRRQEQNELVQKYHAAKTPAEREKIKADLRARIYNDFQKRLANNRRDLENNKKRLARMEKELQKREKKCDEIVDAITQNRLSGNSRRMPPEKRK